jgi:hypothetical protein
MKDWLCVCNPTNCSRIYQRFLAPLEYVQNSPEKKEEEINVEQNIRIHALVQLFWDLNQIT